MKKLLLLCVFMLLSGCKDPRTADSFEDSRDFNSPDLKRADLIRGVYKGSMDFDFSWLGKGKDLINPFLDVSNTRHQLKISINHSGNDENPQMIVVVEAQAEEDKEVAFICTMFNNLSYQFQGEESLNRSYAVLSSDNYYSKGSIGSAKYVSAPLEVSDVAGSSIQCSGGTSSSICIYVGEADKSRENSKAVQGLTKEGASVESFMHLKKNKCQF